VRFAQSANPISSSVPVKALALIEECFLLGKRKLWNKKTRVKGIGFFLTKTINCLPTPTSGHPSLLLAGRGWGWVNNTKKPITLQGHRT